MLGTKNVAAKGVGSMLKYIKPSMATRMARAAKANSKATAKRAATTAKTNKRNWAKKLSKETDAIWEKRGYRTVKGGRIKRIRKKK